VDFRRLRLPILQLPDLRGRSVDAYGRDALVNAIGFAPLGFFAMALFRQQSRKVLPSQVIAVVCFGFVLSLVIEIAQVQLPARVSSATDVMWNTIGTALGAWLALRGPLAARVGGRDSANGSLP
jgi:glycopeptide antibiotics resistance protein